MSPCLKYCGGPIRRSSKMFNFLDGYRWMYCKIICIGILWEPSLDSQYVFNGADSVNFREVKTTTTAKKNMVMTNPKTAVGECYLKKQ